MEYTSQVEVQENSKKKASSETEDKITMKYWLQLDHFYHQTS